MVQDGPRDANNGIEQRNETLVASQTRADPIVYSQPVATITTQPRSPDPPPFDAQQTRLALPISTIQFERSQINGPYIPRSGLDIIRGSPSLHIYQTFELNDSLTALASENRFAIKGPFDESLYVAIESSKSSHRTYLGTSRPFNIRLLDMTNQEALVIRRKMGLGLFACTCVPQSVEVWLPPGDLIGVVRENFSLTSIELIVEVAVGQSFKIIGPTSFTRCLPQEAHFRLIAVDSQQIGSITRTWKADSGCHSVNIYFNDPNLHPKIKSTFLGAAILLEYMFFQKKNCCY